MSTSLAIITGASRGIGQATAAHFLDSGWDVMNISRSPCPIKEVQNHECDLDDAAQINSTCAALDLTAYERISLVHNAAITCKDSYADADPDMLLKMFRINVLAPQILNRALIPHMGTGSSVLFIGSTLSTIGVPNNLSYITTKHALAGLMKATCQDLGGTDIHTALICPGFTETDMLAEVVGDAPESWDFIRSQVLFGRLIEPAEIARFIGFCAENPVINGGVLHANLGQR